MLLDSVLAVSFRDTTKEYVLLNSCIQGAIEAASQKFGLPNANLTLAQTKLPKVKAISNFGANIGITIGCLLGMLPLLYLDQHERKLKAIFHAFDEDGDGFIELDEIKRCMDSSGVNFPKELLEGLIQAVDKSKDGKIDYSEFKLFMSKIEGIVNQDSLRTNANNKLVKWIHDQVGG